MSTLDPKIYSIGISGMYEMRSLRFNTAFLNQSRSSCSVVDFIQVLLQPHLFMMAPPGDLSR